MLHIVEPGGRGGVYQHAAAVAAAAAKQGQQVTLHTTDDCEFSPPSVSVCRCVSWHRKLRPAIIRNLAVVAGYAGTIAHLGAIVRGSDSFNFQGSYKLPLTWATLMVASLRTKTVIFSPHNTFARNGGSVAGWWLKHCIRAASTTMAFCQVDLATVNALGGRGALAPLVLSVPAVAAETVKRWSDRWAAGGRPVVLFAGQIRADKRLDLLLRAVAERLSDQVTVAVVGEDKGAAASNQLLAQQLAISVRWDIGYLPLEEFAAALAAADVVVCPYERASQSGILTLAKAYGTRTVATNVGGLAELADRVVAAGNVVDLAGGIRDSLPRSPRRADIAPV